jgi:hypothetical protein
MTHQDKISIILTFIVGLFAGAYLYVTGFATTFEPPEASSENIYTQFVITGESYGVCETENTCLSFQVLENGAYRALLETRDAKTPLTKEGSIPWSLKRDLADTLTKEVLVLESRFRPLPECKYGAEADNYRFYITRDQVSYTIDTCNSFVDYEGVAWLTLAKLWNHFGSVKW